MTSGIARTAAAAATSPQADTGSPRPRAASQLLPPRPYPGLRPFKKSEWPVFRGRDRLIQDILTILAGNHFVSVIGPSGSGKSSLVRAGVLATLERRHSRVGVRWRTGEMRPGVSPLWAMADGILRSLRPELVAPNGELPAAEVARLRVLIDTSEDGLGLVTREMGLEEDQNFLLLVDQFEEIFRYKSEREDQERARLIELLLGVAADQPAGIHIITTMRSEYLGHCARFPGLAETLNETHYLLPQMTRDELRQAIVDPAELKGGRIEEKLVDRLINDIKSQEDQLPILQHTLLWMWIQEEESREREGLGDQAPVQLGLAEYEQLQAGTAGKTALSRHGDRILDGMSREERRVAEVMFRRMVEVEEHSNRLRRPTRCGTVARLAEVPLDVVQRVVDAFRAEDASFVYASRQTIAEDTSIDITHESLIRQWDTLDRWVRRETAAYEVYNDLCRATQRMREGQRNLLGGLELSRALLWASQEQPTRLWARRYGGDFDAAIRFLTDSEDAEEQQRREQTEAEEAARQQEEERLRRENELKQQALRARLEQQALRTRLAVAAAVVGAILTAIATGAFWYAHGQKVRADAAATQALDEKARANAAAAQALAEAKRADEAVIETKATSLWSRLQLWRDPLTPEEVASLWDLTQQDQEVRAAFVRQLADDPVLVRRFGFKPQPIARAVGLRWPDDARQTFKRSMAYVAGDQFDPTDPFELVSYARALAALTPWLDRGIAANARRNIESAINEIARQERLSDQQLWALPEAVEVAAGFEPHLAIQPARDRLREIIRTAAPAADAGWRGHSISRAIQIMNPDLTPPERLRAVGYLVPLLGQNPDLWSAKAVPRALGALLPTLEADQTPELLNVPQAIAAGAVANVAPDSSYLLALMEVAETLGSMKGGETLVAAFSQAVIKQLALPNDPLQRAALVRAAVPLLERQGDSLPTLVTVVADISLVHQGTSTLQEAEAALRQALPESDGSPQSAQAALDLLHADWTAEPTPNASPNPYRRAAQARLLAMLAPSATPDAAARAAGDLLGMLPDTPDYLSREAIARALAALAPKLSSAERDEARSAAKTALAKTGSSEEATAWAYAIAALLPDERDAATAEIVEALKYPTATEAPTAVLIAALATPWSQEYEAIAGKTMADRTVVDWLETRLPKGHSLTQPPEAPPDLQPDGAGPGRG